MTDEELRAALVGLHAYDEGARDSGIHDEDLRERCKAELKARTASGEPGARLFLSRLVRDMWLSEEALAQGYGIEDAEGFIRWLSDRMETFI
jgi:hypothetical protein